MTTAQLAVQAVLQELRHLAEEIKSTQSKLEQLSNAQQRFEISQGWQDALSSVRSLREYLPQFQHCIQENEEIIQRSVDKKTEKKDKVEKKTVQRTQGPLSSRNLTIEEQESLYQLKARRAFAMGNQNKALQREVMFNEKRSALVKERYVINESYPGSDTLHVIHSLEAKNRAAHLKISELQEQLLKSEQKAEKFQNLYEERQHQSENGDSTCKVKSLNTQGQKSKSTIMPKPAGFKEQSFIRPSTSVNDIVRKNECLLERNEDMQREIQRLKRDNAALVLKVKTATSERDSVLNELTTSTMARKDLSARHEKLLQQKKQLLQDMERLSADFTERKWREQLLDMRQRMSELVPLSPYGSKERFKAHAVNVALGKECNISSKRGVGVIGSTSTDPMHPAIFAVNGNSSNDYESHVNCVATRFRDHNAWWEVDLGEHYFLRNFTIWPILSVEFYLSGVTVTIDGKECYNITNVKESTKHVSFECTSLAPPVFGRVIRLNKVTPQKTLYILGFCEFEAWTCKTGRWGSDCEQDCGHCYNVSEGCRVMDGRCSLCKEGYKLPRCTDCDPFSYGENCELKCSKNCGSACDRELGRCTCKPGFYSFNCSFMCSPNCLDVCDQEEGHCSCQFGFQPPFCTHRISEGDDQLYAVVALTCIVFVVMLFGVIIPFIVRPKKKLKEKKLKPKDGTEEQQQLEDATPALDAIAETNEGPNTTNQIVQDFTGSVQLTISVQGSTTGLSTSKGVSLSRTLSRQSRKGSRRSSVISAKKTPSQRSDFFRSTNLDNLISSESIDYILVPRDARLSRASRFSRRTVLSEASDSSDSSNQLDLW